MAFNLFQPPSIQYGTGEFLNRFMSRQAQLPYQANLPGYQSLVGQRSSNIGGLLQGQVPTDVLQQIQQRGAERGVATGSPGSPNANAAWLRALGLTSLGLQQQGSQQLGQAIEQTPVPEIWNPIELYMSQLKSREELEAARIGEKGAGRVGVPGWVSPEKYSASPFY